MQLLSIDSDHAFFPPMVDHGLDSKIQVKSVTLNFPHMENPLNPEAIADFLSLNKYELLEQWLSDCRLLNSGLIGNLQQKREGLFKPNVIKKLAPLDSWFSTPNFSFIPIAFEHGTLDDIYQRWLRIERALSKAPQNHFELLREVSPRWASTYEKVFKEETTVSKRFDLLASKYTQTTSKLGFGQRESFRNSSILSGPILVI